MGPAVKPAGPMAKGKSKRTSARYPKRREQILLQAPSVFNRLGVRGATLADIAALFDLDITSIRYYFPKKEDLVAEVFLRSIAVHRGLIEAAKAHATPKARVRALVAAYFAFRLEIRRGTVLDVMQFGDFRSLTEPHASEVWPGYSDMFRGVREIVGSPKEIRAGRQRINARTHMLFSQFLRSVFWLNNYEPSEFQRIEERFLDILLNGLASPSSRWNPRVLELPADADATSSTADAFLLAATELINEQGYRGASVERIAAKLNLSKGAFYHHLEAKDDLVVACFNRSFAILSGAQQVARDAGGSGLDQLVASLATLVHRQQTAAGPLLRHSALTSVEAETRRKMVADMDQVALRFGDMIADGISDGSIRPCDPRIGGQMLLALVNSAEELVRWVPGVDKTNATDLYVRPMVFGLLS